MPPIIQPQLVELLSRRQGDSGLPDFPNRLGPTGVETPFGTAEMAELTGRQDSIVSLMSGQIEGRKEVSDEELTKQFYRLVGAAKTLETTDLTARPTNPIARMNDFLRRALNPNYDRQQQYRAAQLRANFQAQIAAQMIDISQELRLRNVEDPVVEEAKKKWLDRFGERQRQNAILDKLDRYEAQRKQAGLSPLSSEEKEAFIANEWNAPKPQPMEKKLRDLLDIKSLAGYINADTLKNIGRSDLIPALESATKAKAKEQESEEQDPMALTGEAMDLFDKWRKINTEEQWLEVPEYRDGIKIGKKMAKVEVFLGGNLEQAREQFFLEVLIPQNPSLWEPILAPFIKGGLAPAGGPDVGYVQRKIRGMTKPNADSE